MRGRLFPPEQSSKTLALLNNKTRNQTDKKSSGTEKRNQSPGPESEKRRQGLCRQRQPPPPAAINKVGNRTVWFDPAVQFFIFQSELRLFSPDFVKKVPPPIPSRHERRLFPPEHSLKTSKLLNEPVTNGNNFCVISTGYLFSGFW